MVLSGSKTQTLSTTDQDPRIPRDFPAIRRRFPSDECTLNITHTFGGALGPRSTEMAWLVLSNFIDKSIPKYCVRYFHGANVDAYNFA